MRTNHLYKNFTNEGIVLYLFSFLDIYRISVGIPCSCLDD